MRLMYRQAEVCDFAFRFVVTKYHVSGGRFRSRTARSNLFFRLSAQNAKCQPLSLPLMTRMLTLVSNSAESSEGRVSPSQVISSHPDSGEATPDGDSPPVSKLGLGQLGWA
jgi:hypothetical protein